jgi:hypothetical protein
MNKATIIRLILSGLIAFISYAAWAYYANSLVSDDPSILLKAALVQGVYSGSITLIFTFLLEIFFKRFGSSNYCLGFIVPRINAQPTATNPCSTQKTFEASLTLSEQKCHGSCLPGVILSPLPALFIQSVMVIGVNIFFNTPNLWLTVAPSIFFSAIYGYAYSIGLAKKLHS